ncbi:MAG: hypothetical protein R3C03_15935 [Pirellulaceae bacterium]
MNEILVIFGDSTADEMQSAFERAADFSRFTSCRKFFVELENLEQRLKAICETENITGYCIGVVDREHRQRIAFEAEKLGLEPYSIIDPSATIDRTAEIGKGCFVAAQAVVSCRAKIEDHSIVHFHATIGHDARLGQHCIVLPGARVSGRVQLQNHVLIGSNAFIFQGVSIGEHASIDALTYVRDDVAARRVISVRRP